MPRLPPVMTTTFPENSPGIPFPHHVGDKPCHVMAGLVPAIHEACRRTRPYGCRTGKVIMDRRVKPGHDD
jgi:hypothetical protein